MSEVKVVIDDIINEFIQYVPYAITTGVIVLAALYILLRVISRKVPYKDRNFTGRKLFVIYIAYIYCFIVISITYLSREPGSRDSLDLKLFSTFSSRLEYNIYPIENIILFIPFGFLLPLLWNKFYHPLCCMAAGFIFSLTIEISQHLTKRGFLQIDDMMTNTIGTLMGCLIAMLCRYISRNVLYLKQKS